MVLEVPLGEEGRAHVLVPLRSVEDGAFLDVGHPRDDLGGADVEAHSNPRTEELGEGVETDHVAAVSFLIEREDGRDRLAAVAEVAVGTVFDDGQVELVAEVEEGLPLGQADGDARGVLEIGDDVDELRELPPGLPSCSELNAHSDDVGAVLFNVDPYESRPLHLKRDDGAGEGRPIDHHRVARIQQEAAGEIETGLAATGDDDVLVADPDRVAFEKASTASTSVASPGIGEYCMMRSMLASSAAALA